MVWVVGLGNLERTAERECAVDLGRQIRSDWDRSCDAASAFSHSPRHTRSDCAAGLVVFDGMRRMVHAALAARMGGERGSV